MNKIPVGAILKEYGVVTEEQIEEAIKWQRLHKGSRFEEVLIAMGFMTEQQLLSALGQKMGMEVISAALWPVDERAVERIPYTIAKRNNLIAIGFEEETLVVAIDDPMNFYAEEEVNLAVDGPVKYVLSPKEEITKAIEDYYAEIEARSAASAANAAAVDKEEDSMDSFLEGELGEGDQTPVVKLLNSFLIRGYKNNASDIHIEPREKRLVVRMRIDGQLVEYASLDKNLHPPMAARAKILSGMDIAEKRLPQDGHFKTVIYGLEMNIRTSTVPTIYGEKIVLRFLNTSSAIDRADTFGMDEDSYRKVLEILKYSNGIMYITGPTGSGKTTTLYMILDSLVKKPINIVTIEDPVEKYIDGINQIQVNPQAGLTFERGLRAALRQDPDVIMVGETRDSQTAQTSVRAAITGHLVLSTLHTNDAVSAIVRMTDMGVEPFMVANSLSGVLAQRLARKICPNCAAMVEPNEEERRILGPETRLVRRGMGCHLCSHTGYRGRVAVHEVLLMDREIRRMVTEQCPAEKIYEYARTVQKMSSLKENLLHLIEQGITTVEELVRLTYGN